MAVNNAVHLSWPVPFDGNSPLLGYNILRAGGSGVFSRIAALNRINGQLPRPSFIDRNLVTGPYQYQVQAVNALGVGTPSAPVTAAIAHALVTNSGIAADDDTDTRSTRAKNDVKAEADETMCTPPGETVVEDGLADPLTTPGPTLLASEDIEWIAVSEPGALDHKIVVTLKVTALADPLPPQHRWVVYFTMPDGTEWYLTMSNADGPTVVYEYGHALTNDTVSAAPLGLFEKVGDLEPESHYLPDGQIALVLDTSKIPGWADAIALDPIYAKARDSSANPGTQNAGITRDDTSSGFYQTVGNAHCKAKALPVAAFESSGTTGTVPATLRFDANTPETFVDTGANVVTYRWNFGDGHTLETTSAAVSHTYTGQGAFRVSLQIVDSLGQTSNFAYSTLLLGEMVDSNGMLDEGYDIFSVGALPLPLLLVLSGLGLLGRYRRRAQRS
jgi:hypothetical protein